MVGICRGCRRMSKFGELFKYGYCDSCLQRPMRNENWSVWLKEKPENRIYCQQNRCPLLIDFIDPNNNKKGWCFNHRPKPAIAG